MARREYGGSLTDFTTDKAGLIRAGLDAYFWTARNGGSLLTDVVALSGAVAGGKYTSGANGAINVLGPEGYDADGIWVSASPDPAATRLWLRALVINGTGSGSGGGGTPGPVSDATAASKGVVQLAGDFAGTAASPTVATVKGGLTPATLTSGVVPDAQLPARLGTAALAAKADLVGGVIPTAQIPALAIAHTQVVASQAAMLALTSAQVQPGDLAVRTDGAGTFILTATDPSQLANWTRLNAPTDVVQSVNGQTGSIVLGATDVGASPAGAYIKPASGIPAGDLASGVIPDTATLLTKTDAAATYGQKTVVDQNTAAIAALPGLYAPKPLARALPKLYARLAARTTMPCRLAFVGSSTTAGGNATAPEFRYVNRLLSLLQAAYPSGLSSEQPTVTSTTADWGTLSTAAGVHGYNAGIGGTKAVDYITSTTSPKIAALNPGMVLHMVGANDYREGTAVATFKAQVAGKISTLKAAISGPCVHVLIAPYPRSTSGGSPVAAWSDYATAMAEIAAADPDNVAYFDLTDEYALAGWPGTDPLDLIDTDNIHMTNAGHALMADAIRRRLDVVQVAAAAAAPVTPAPAQFVQDAMTGSDGALLSSRSGEVGASWTRHPGSSSTGTEPTLASGRVYQPGTGNSRYTASGAPASADYVVEADLTCISTQTSGTLGLLGRCTTTDPRSSYSLQYGPSNGNWAVQKTVAGTTTTIGTVTSVPLAAGKTAHAELRMKGATISAQVTIDGVTTPIMSVTDSDVTGAGRAGLFFASATSTATTGHHLDNVTATAI